MRVLEFEGDNQRLVVRDIFPVARVHDGYPDFHVANEHLVEVTALTMGLGSTWKCWLEVVV